MKKSVKWLWIEDFFFIKNLNKLDEISRWKMNTFAEGGGGGFKFALVSWTEHIAEGGGGPKVGL
jgi:hypothetical protein